MDMHPQEPEEPIEETPNFDAPKKEVSESVEVVEEETPPIQEVEDSVTDEDEDDFEVEVKVIQPNTQAQTDWESRLADSLVSEIGNYTGRATGFTSQYMQVGMLVDMWADLIEGFGDKAETFLENFQSDFKSRDIQLMTQRVEDLQSTGFMFAPYRRMLFYRRSPIAVTVYVATQGKDLYVSWRAFAQARIAVWKVAVLGGLSALVAFMVMSVIGFFDRAIVDLQNSVYGTQLYYPLPNIGAGAFWGGLFFVLVGGWLCLQGYQKLDGDFLGYFREPLYELTADDIAASSAAVHKSIIHTADKLGIDIAKLEVREPFYKNRKRPRF